MKLRDEILKEHSKKQSLFIAGWVGGSDKRYKELLNLLLHDDYRVVQRSAWIVSLVADKHPELIKKNIRALINRLSYPGIHTAVKRNVIRVLQIQQIPLSLQAKVLNICFGYLADPVETVSVKCFSMTVLANLAKQYPEIKREIILAINSRGVGSSPGIKSRAKKIIKTLEKISG